MRYCCGNGMRFGRRKEGVWGRAKLSLSKKIKIKNPKKLFYRNGTACGYMESA